ncbi:MAG: prephenate dehydratase [Candidatus Schekmanbacteria bacterium]|nr:MAG: prephenate dehydratase [Candidatus Schekmanbacteria bacterium]
MKNKIEDLRKKIDAIDSKILRLLSERGKIARQIGNIKKKNNSRILVPHREEEILKRIEKENPGPFSSSVMKGIFKEIISATRSLEAPIVISCLGPEASFSHLASIKHFGKSSNVVPKLFLKDVFEDVEKGSASFGVVPIENSYEGTVNETLDLFLEFSLKITGEIFLKINHNLMNITGKAEDIKTIVSHPQPIAQCREWLTKNMPSVKIETVSSTSMAAKIASKDKTKGAIASKMASDIYNLKPVYEHIEDSVNNFTRFLILGKEINEKTGKDKTSIIFAVNDRAGALHDALSFFSENRISLTKIESRPSKKKPWEYIFYIDFLGHIENRAVKRALAKLEANCLFLNILGSYPKGSLD